MAFINTPRTPISWEASPPVEITGEAYELLIGSGYKLDIGAGFNLTIKPEAAEAVYTHVDKSQGSNTWPGVREAADVFLDIGGGYTLLIDSEHKLIIEPFRLETPWSTLSRTPIVV